MTRPASTDTLALQAEPASTPDTKPAVLPLALQDSEITEGDVEVLLRVAKDKHAQAGRYKRTPKKVAEPERK